MRQPGTDELSRGLRVVAVVDGVLRLIREPDVGTGLVPKLQRSAPDAAPGQALRIKTRERWEILLEDYSDTSEIYYLSLIVSMET